MEVDDAFGQLIMCFLHWNFLTAEIYDC